MGEALRVNTVLQTLDLSSNDLGKVGGKAVREALSVNSVLQSLDMIDDEEEEEEEEEEDSGEEED